MVPHSAGSQRRRRLQIRTDVLLAEDTITEQDDLGTQQGLCCRPEVRHIERLAVIGQMAHEAARTGDPQRAHAMPHGQRKQITGVATQQLDAAGSGECSKAT